MPTRYNDYYRDLNLTEVFTVLKPYKAISVEISIGFFLLTTEIIGNHLYVHPASITVSV